MAGNKEKSQIIREKMDSFMDIWRIAIKKTEDRKTMMMERRDFISLRNEFFKSDSDVRIQEILDEMDIIIGDLNDLYGEF